MSPALLGEEMGGSYSVRGGGWGGSCSVSGGGWAAPALLGEAG